MCTEGEGEGEGRSSSLGDGMMPSCRNGVGGHYGGGSSSSSGVDLVMELIQGSGSRRSSLAGGEVARATKSHSEAERRRRQRINAHLATLRALLPNTAKMDKASLLTEVVRQVRELRKSAESVRSSEGGLWMEVVPGEADEVKLDRVASAHGSELMKASVCCEDRPGLLADLNQAIQSVKARAVKAEMSTVGGRTKSVVLMEGDVEGEDRSTLQTALRAVLYKPGPGGYRFVDYKRLRLSRPVGRI